MKLVHLALAEGSLPLIRRPDFRKTSRLQVLGGKGCPICRHVSWLDDRYISCFQQENFASAKTLDSLTRSLGFCAADGARTAAYPSERFAVAAIHEVLARRVGKALSREVSPRRGGGGGFIFGEYDRCPACRNRDEVTGHAASFLATALGDPVALRQYEGLRSVCFPHMQAMVPYLEESTVRHVLEVHRKAVDSAAESIAAVGRENGTNRFPDEETWEDAFIKAIHLAAGWDRFSDIFELTLAEKPSSIACGPAEDLVEFMSRNDGCPVCNELDRAWAEWIARLCEMISRGEEAGDLLPVCPEHIWAAVCTGPPLVVVASIRNALRIIAGQVQAAMDTLAPASSPVRPGLITRIREAIHGPRRRTGAAREVLGRPLSCPVCKRFRETCDMSLALLSTLLKDPCSRDAFERGYGLCLKHFTRALALKPPPAVRTILTEVVAGKLVLLQWELEEYSRKNSRTISPELSGIGNTAWKRAVTRFSGSFVWGAE